jgi:CBS-domain-containing membrane protein
MPAHPLKVISDRDLPIPGSDPWFARPGDTAITVMTDFRERSSVTIAEAVPIDAALLHMKHAGVRCAFVTSELRRVTGLITAYDILGEAPLRFLQSVSGQRKDVLVRDIMVKLVDWRVVEVRDLEKMSVETLYQLFESTRLTHIAVMESDAERPRQLRGLLSASKVKRLLSR